jgi:hypothetical protein
MGGGRNEVWAPQQEEVFMIGKNFLRRALLTCTLAGGLVMAVGTAPIHAARNDNDDCQNRIAKAQADIDRDAGKHGQRSHQVRDDLKKLDSEREWCAKHHADWDHSKDGQYDHYRDIQQH